MMFKHINKTLNKMTTIEFESKITAAIPLLKPLALRLTKNSDETDDLLQLTFMKAWMNKHQFSVNTNFKGWLYTIMRNTFISEYQRKKRSRVYNDLTTNHYFINSSEYVTRGPEVDHTLNINEIYQTIDALPEQNRVPFKMFIEGYKYEEISNQLGLPMGTVKSRIYLARQELKGKLER